jgi:hypothetical protein
VAVRVHSMRSAREHRGADLDGKKGYRGIGRVLAPFYRGEEAGRRLVYKGA